MKVCDLVRPLMSCAGDPGTARCETALVTVTYKLATDWLHDEFNQSQCRVVCKCGSTVQFEKHLEVISEGQ